MRLELRYIEKVTPNHDGPAWIGWVTFNASRRTVYYRDLTLHRIYRGGIIGNHRDPTTGDEYWVSGVKRNGEDRHWVGGGPVRIDEDARDEYRQIRGAR